MQAFVVRVLINAVAIWVATLVVPALDASPGQGESVWDAAVTFLLLGLIFGLVNAIIKPVVKLFSIPFYILTLGLFTFVVNALMLLITEWIAVAANLTFDVRGFWAGAVLGSIVISLVSTIVSVLLPDSLEGKSR
jgi:putative membrane protein